jgi:hypothetical protein
MKVLEFFQEDNGRLSSARLLAFFSVSSFILDWQLHIWKGLEFNPSLTILGFVLGVVGLKVIQKFAEQNTATDGTGSSNKTVNVDVNT